MCLGVHEIQIPPFKHSVALQTLLQECSAGTLFCCEKEVCSPVDPLTQANKRTKGGNTVTDGGGRTTATVAQLHTPGSIGIDRSICRVRSAVTGETLSTQNLFEVKLLPP